MNENNLLNSRDVYKSILSDFLLTQKLFLRRRSFARIKGYIAILPEKITGFTAYFIDRGLKDDFYADFFCPKRKILSILKNTGGMNAFKIRA